MSQTPTPEEGMFSSDQLGTDQETTMSQTLVSKQEVPPGNQPDGQETTMPQTPVSEQEVPSSNQSDGQETTTPQTPASEEEGSGGQLDIGPGGIIIADSPNNRRLLERIERATPLAPSELYVLALSYQQAVPNSDVGNRLGFIGLSTIFQNSQRLIPELYPQGDDTNLWAHFNGQSQILADLSVPVPVRCWIDSLHYKTLPRSEQEWYQTNCEGKSVQRKTALLINYNGMNLIIEGTQIGESKTYVVLGVGLSYLGVR